MANNLEDQFGRPKIGTIESLYWIMGYFAAGYKESSDSCPFKSTMNSYEYWQKGHKARTVEKK